MDLKNINDPGHWHIAIALAGLAITVASLAAGSKPMVLTGLGMIAFGVGEMRNHPYQERLLTNEYGGYAGKVSGHPRNPSPLGLVLDAIGILLFVGGLGWFVLAD